MQFQVDQVLRSLANLPNEFVTRVQRLWRHPQQGQLVPSELARDSDQLMRMEKILGRMRYLGHRMMFLPLEESYTQETEEMRQVYPEMLRDPYVKSALSSKVLAVAQLEPQFHPASERECDKDAVEYIKYNLEQRCEGGMSAIVRNILFPGSIYGWSLCEPKITDEVRGRWAGKYVLEALKDRDPRLLQLLGDSFRNITAVRDMRTFDEWHPSNFVIWRNMPLFQQVFGTSDFRAAYRAYWLKDTAYRLWSIGLERYTLPMLKGTYANIDQKPELEANMMAARGQSWMSLPEGASIEALEIASSDGNAFKLAIDSLNEEIVIGIAGATLQMLQGQVSDGQGSSEVHKSIAELYQWYLANEVSSVINTQLIPMLIDPNFPGDVGYPRCQLGGVNDAALTASVQVDRFLWEIGKPLSSEELGERYDRMDPKDEKDSLMNPSILSQRQQIKQIKDQAEQQKQQMAQQEQMQQQQAEQAQQPQEQPAQMAEEEPVKKDLMSSLRTLQESHHAGKLHRQAAVANATHVLGLDPEQAEAMFPHNQAQTVTETSPVKEMQGREPMQAGSKMADSGVTPFTGKMKSMANMPFEEYPDPTKVKNAQTGEDMAEEHEFASTQFNLPDDVADKIKAIAAHIPDEHINEEEGGREKVPHATALFGLHGDNADEVKEQVHNFGPIEAKLGKLQVFQNPKADVLYAEIHGKGLHDLHDRLAQLPHTDTHPEYKPHVCVAYLKPGFGGQYVGKSEVTGLGGKLTKLMFSDKRRRLTEVPLSDTEDFATEDWKPAPDGKRGGKREVNVKTGKVRPVRKLPSGKTAPVRKTKPVNERPHGFKIGDSVGIPFHDDENEQHIVGKRGVVTGMPHGKEYTVRGAEMHNLTTTPSLAEKYKPKTKAKPAESGKIAAGKNFIADKALRDGMAAIEKDKVDDQTMAGPGHLISVEEIRGNRERAPAVDDQVKAVEAKTEQDADFSQRAHKALRGGDSQWHGDIARTQINPANLTNGPASAHMAAAGYLANGPYILPLQPGEERFGSGGNAASGATEASNVLGMLSGPLHGPMQPFGVNTSGKTPMYALKALEGHTARVDAGLHAAIMGRHPGATLHVPQSHKGLQVESPLAIQHEGKLIGAMMPMTHELPEEIGSKSESLADIAEPGPHEAEMGAERIVDGKKLWKVGSVGIDNPVRLELQRNKEGDWSVHNRLAGDDPIAEGLSRKQAIEKAKEIVKHAHGHEPGTGKLIFKPKER